ncbi:hypothetical protein [Clostridium saccharobutylicum]|uniref:Uncharacterized protein n=1 Tax=Clostridium saccharobutylicum DSM 13864 TaxID=1345695 RepID=U5MS93_CLOSA|nr:hypothetical protein [Clostridium saccharobutylicum]AGX43460.1 hypothetical protein CLSA_c24870 [Clostridium saccharobutylicum DSM 13864]
MDYRFLKEIININRLQKRERVTYKDGSLSNEKMSFYFFITK